jgi:hypothetical protein
MRREIESEGHGQIKAASEARRRVAPLPLTRD